MRGKLGNPWKVSELKRITPACAGKTGKKKRGLCPAKDHPRVCGENTKSAYAKTVIGGSPPRVRGKQNADGKRARGGRITPACAGKTSPPRARPSGGQDHPRVCGENTNTRKTQMSAKGSPPRVRGKQCPKNGTALLVGITPACAGKTDGKSYRK